jgi:sec-independent protein translocase protein TatB
MFDIGFWEIALVGVVALLVLGPERLPKVARVAGMWLGKGRRFMASVKGEIDRELKADELKRIMADQAKSNDLFEIAEQAREGLANANNALNKPLADNSPAQPSTLTASVSSTAKQAAATKASTSGANESDRKA